MSKSIDKDVYEAAFSAFLESEECDEKNWIIFALMRAAFDAGIRCAGGEAPEHRGKN